MERKFFKDFFEMMEDQDGALIEDYDIPDGFGTWNGYVEFYAGGFDPSKKQLEAIKKFAKKNKLNIIRETMLVGDSLSLCIWYRAAKDPSKNQAIDRKDKSGSNFVLGGKCLKTKAERFLFTKKNDLIYGCEVFQE